MPQRLSPDASKVVRPMVKEVTPDLAGITPCEQTHGSICRWTCGIYVSKVVRPMVKEVTRDLVGTTPCGQTCGSI